MDSFFERRPEKTCLKISYMSAQLKPMRGLFRPYVFVQMFFIKKKKNKTFQKCKNKLLGIHISDLIITVSSFSISKLCYLLM